MKAIAYQKSLPIHEADALRDITLPEPVAKGRDLLVEVKAISVNPVDTKVRKNAQPAADEWKVLGWDVAGVVHAVGPEATMFKKGDRVWYAGSIIRPGANSELHLVDERIVGNMPATLDFAAAAALPLTGITAWEMLFDRLEIKPGKKVTGESLLIIGAGGGVGSIMTQLARRLTGLTVIGTASRRETKKWVSELGAHHVIDHSKSLTEELKRIAIPQPNYIVSLTQTDQHFAHIVEAIAPQGKFGLIDDPKTLDVTQFKRKSVSVHWESMFTRSMFNTPDMLDQHDLLTEMAALVDAGLLRTTLGEHFGTINATNLKRAHALLESGKSRGKIVLEGF
ncbi:MAG TPA: zinc-binding alcohol dehydrogenase family protein [Methylophilaceae bacterium]